VRLVHRDEGRLRAAQPVQEAVHHEALGRDVEQLHAAGVDGAHDGRTLGAILAAVDHGRRHAGLAQPVHLILHQRDQGRDDDGEPAQVRGRRLVAERLAAAGGQDDERVTAGQNTVDRLLLKRKEPIVPPDASDRLVRELDLDDAAMIADAPRAA